MFAVAYRYMQRQDEAEDVVQDVLMKLWQLREKLPPDKQLLPFLLTVVRNQCLDRLRAKENQKTNMEVGDIEQLSQDTQQPINTDDLVEEKDRLRHLLGLMDQLPSDQQKVLRMKAIDDLETDEIAKRMNVTPENVRQLLSRARKRLRELAQKQELI